MNELREYTMERIEDLRAYEHNAKIHSDDQFVLVDLGSQNGTRLNGNLVDP